MMAKLGYPLALVTSFGLGGCGFGVPEMNPLSPDQNAKDRNGINTEYSTQGNFENALVDHINCSIKRGLLRIAGDLDGAAVHGVDWLYKWGTSINLTLQVDEISNANPGVSVANQWGNEIKTLPLKQSATYPQAFLFGAAATGSAHSTRQETIQYTYPNAWLLADARKNRQNYGPS
jgi:hypothetical protein